jgi:uncharacterized membrane protein YkgB
MKSCHRVYLNILLTKEEVKVTATNISTYESFAEKNSNGADISALSGAIEKLGKYALYYSLALVLVYIGGMKFTAYEAQGISGLVANSPLLAWTYNLFSQQGLSNLIGLIELAIAALIAARPLNPRASALGGVLAVGLFATTLSFLFSTPGIVEASLGFPALTVMPGQFLLKDIVLLGAAVYVIGDSLRHITESK